MLEVLGRMWVSLGYGQWGDSLIVLWIVAFAAIPASILIYMLLKR